MIEGSPYNKLIQLNDTELSSHEQREQDRKLQEEITRRMQESTRERNRRLAKYQRERNQDHLMMKEMTDAFGYQLEGEGTLNGHKVWILAATPKPGWIPPNREGKVLLGCTARCGSTRLPFNG